jgi:tetratricopeptide (TPR) repeat protein
MAFPSTRSSRNGALLCALVAGLAASTVAMGAEAREDDQLRRAKEHYRKGDDAFRDGLFAEALREFEAGYKLVPRPAFLVNMGHCRRRLGDLKEAHTLYRLFVDSDPTSELRAEVEEVIVELEKEMGAAPARVPVPLEPPPVTAPSPAGTPAQVVSHSPPPPAKPFYRRWQTWVIAGSVVALGCAAIIVTGRSGASYQERGTLGTLGTR